MKRLIREEDIIVALLYYDDIIEFSLPFITRKEKGHVMFSISKDQQPKEGKLSYYISFWTSKRYKNTAPIFEIMQPRCLFRLFTKKA